MNHIVTIAQYMGVELIIGIFAGILSKEMIRFNAQISSSKKVFLPSDYCSIRYGNNLPKSEFYNLFNLQQNLVIAHYKEEKVVREDFYTFLGDRTSLIYRDEILNDKVFKNAFLGLLGNPIYVCTVVIPSMAGFLLGLLFSFIPSIEIFFTHLLISGLVWGLVGFWLPPLLYQESE